MFEVGDVVECWRKCCGLIPSDWEPKIGGFYRVAAFDIAYDGLPIIDLKEDPLCFGDAAWEAEAFRKLPPAEPEFISLMRGLKAPSKIREDA